jgi:hypothetical protein
MSDVETAVKRRFAKPQDGLEGRRALVVVVATDVAETITRVLADLRRHARWADVVVIDNGSSDGTAERARRARARVLDLPLRLGAGGALQAGFRYALAGNYDLVFQFDAGGRHWARRLAGLARPILAEEADLVVGSRYLSPRGQKRKGLRVFGIRLLARLMTRLIEQRITDPTSGFRAAGRRAIQLFAREFPQDYPEPLALVLAWSKGLRVREGRASTRRRRPAVPPVSLGAGLGYMTKVVPAVLMDRLRRPVHVEGEVA